MSESAAQTERPFVLGYEVVLPPLKQNGKPRPISGRFTIKASADEFCAISQRGGTPDAYVREVIGFEGRKR